MIPGAGGGVSSNARKRLMAIYSLDIGVNGQATKKTIAPGGIVYN